MVKEIINQVKEAAEELANTFDDKSEVVEYISERLDTLEAQYEKGVDGRRYSEAIAIEQYKAEVAANLLVSKFVIGFSKMAIGSAVLINAIGVLVACYLFGSTQLASVISVFNIGILLGVSAIGVTYIAQALFAAKIGKVAEFFRIVCVNLAACSYASFACGAYLIHSNLVG